MKLLFENVFFKILPALAWAQRFWRCWVHGWLLLYTCRYPSRQRGCIPCTLRDSALHPPVRVKLHVDLCICMICIYIYVYIYIYIYIAIYAYIFVCLYCRYPLRQRGCIPCTLRDSAIYPPVRVKKYVDMCKCIIYIYTYIYVCICIYIYVYLYINIWIYICMLILLLPITTKGLYSMYFERFCTPPTCTSENICRYVYMCYTYIYIYEYIYVYVYRICMNIYLYVYAVATHHDKGTVFHVFWEILHFTHLYAWKIRIHIYVYIIYIYIYIYVCIYICTYIYTYTYMCFIYIYCCYQ